MKNHIKAILHFSAGGFIVAFSAIAIHLAGLLTHPEIDRPRYELGELRFADSLDATIALRVSEAAEALPGIDYAYINVSAKSLIFSFDPKVQNRYAIRSKLDAIARLDELESESKKCILPNAIQGVARNGHR